MRREQEHEPRLPNPAPIITLPLPDSQIPLPRPKNPFSVVANTKTTNSGNELDPHLIAQAEQIVKDAKSGKLKGLGFLADYGNGYKVGLEGSYHDNPESAVLPLKMLDHNIMTEITKKG